MLKHLRMYYVLVALPYVLLLVGSYVFFAPIKRTVLNNPIPHLNYAIFVIILTGGIFVLINARRLVREARIMREFSRAIHAKTDATTLRNMASNYTGDLACILQLVASSSDRAISHQEQAALEHELANARSCLVRRNALPQYLTGLLVAMGLLGTFIGLLATLADITVLIGSFAEIDMHNIDPLQVFRVMIERMKAPMSSMGIAFSTSMFGLLGSIVLGLMMLGIRRLQGDIISVLGSEVARHIEVALSFESISFRGGNASIAVSGEAVDLTAKILLRIEERLAEAARLRQRALSAEIEDFKKQRADMLHALTEQTEASHSFRTELQQLGGQLANIFGSMERANGEISGQISALTVQLAGESQETRKLLATQIDEQRRLRDALDSYNIKEWLAETTRLQQRALTAEIEDFRNQRADMLRTLAAQTEASKDFRSELQRLGTQLASIFDSMEKSNSEISSQISELTVHSGADAKEAQRLLTLANTNLRNGLQQLSSQIGTLAGTTEKGNEELAVRISSLTAQLETVAMGARQFQESARSDLLNALQQHGSDLETQLGTLTRATETGHSAVAARISDLLTQQADSARDSLEQLAQTSNDVRSVLQQLSTQLGSLSSTTDQGNAAISAHLAELTARLSTEAGESHRLLALLAKDEGHVQADGAAPLRVGEQQG